MEAVIAAVYLDSGFSTTQALILRLWGSRIFTAQDRAADPKSSLQEWAQARGLPTPVYTDISRSGPDHQPVFIVEATLENGHTARGEAASKKNAQVQAATALLIEIKDIK